MKKATIYVSHEYLDNKIFDLDNKILNRDNCLYSWYSLRKEFGLNGYDLSTQDINNIHESSFVIYIDMPRNLNDINKNNNNYVILLESEVIRPDNWVTENHSKFKKVFTWNDDLLDNKKYIKCNFPNEIPKSLDFSISLKHNLCVMIAGNKTVNHPKELYSKRIEAIKWFEENALNEFDLFGIGWDRYVFNGTFTRRLNAFKTLVTALAKNYPSYKGAVKSKNGTLKKYKFSICYENARDISGYVTEKIFDCLFAGCVPVYWGAPNIDKLIPQSVFIDRRQFKSYSELYKYMKCMSEQEYTSYLDSIQKYIFSENIYSYSTEGFCKTLTEIVLGDISK